jgi:hypothetical protein
MPVHAAYALRPVIELSPEQLRALDPWRNERGVNRAEAVRKAVARLLRADEQRGAQLVRRRGLWPDRGEDGLA